MAQTLGPLEIDLHEEGLRIAESEGVREIPFAYCLHARFIKTRTNARLLVEGVKEAWPKAFSERKVVRLRLSHNLGLFSLRLPFAPGTFPNPEHQLQWEFESNAPEAASSYVYDWEERDGETHLIAIRVALLEFLDSFFGELDVQIETIQIEGNEDGCCFHPGRSAEHRKALEEESFKALPRPMLWSGVAALVALCVGFIFWPESQSPLVTTPSISTLEPSSHVEQPLREEVLTDSQPVIAETNQEIPEEFPPAGSPSIAPADAESPDTVSPSAASPGAVPPRTVSVPSGGELAAWKYLLADFSEQESRLPEFFVLDAGGVLVRQGFDQTPSLNQILTRPSRVSRVSDTAYWLHFDQPLSPTVPGSTDFSIHSERQKPRTLDLQRLSDLSSQLKAPPSRIIFQRRWLREAEKGTIAWRFEKNPSGEPRGWRVRVFSSELED